MDSILKLLRREPRAPRFFAAYAQSSLGTGAAYVALVLVAYQRFHSPLAISLVLLADMAPPIVLGPLLGAAVDRWSRRRSAIAADCTRALAFIGIAVTNSFWLTFFLALAAGAGTSLWKPAAMAGLPSVVSRERLPAATALYGALTEIGYTVGPGLAAIVLLFSGPRALLFANAGSFAISATLLSTLSFGARVPRDGEPKDSSSLLREASDGLRAVARTPVVRAVIVATSSILFFGALINVAELLIANQLGAGKTGYAVIVTLSGVAIGCGSLLGKWGGALPVLERRFIGGMVIFAAGLVVASASPPFAGVVAGLTFGALGNGMVIVFQRLIIQASVDDELLGRMFGAQIALDGVAFTVAYLAAAGLLTFLSPRELFITAGSGAALVAAITLLVLRKTWIRPSTATRRAAVADTSESLAALGSPDPR